MHPPKLFSLAVITSMAMTHSYSTASDCTSALPIADGVIELQQSLPTEPGPANCFGNLLHQSWHTFTAPIDGQLTVSLCTDADVLFLEVWDVCDCTTTEQPQVCRTINTSNGSCGVGWEETIVLSAGECVLLRIMSVGEIDATAEFRFEDPCEAAPLFTEGWNEYDVLAGQLLNSGPIPEADGITSCELTDPSLYEYWLTYEAGFAGTAQLEPGTGFSFTQSFRVWKGASCPVDPADSVACVVTETPNTGEPYTRIEVDEGERFLMRVLRAENRGAVRIGRPPWETIETLGYGLHPAPMWLAMRGLPLNETSGAQPPVTRWYWFEALEDAIVSVRAQRSGSAFSPPLIEYFGQVTPASAPPDATQSVASGSRSTQFQVRAGERHLLRVYDSRFGLQSRPASLLIDPVRCIADITTTGANPPSPSMPFSPGWGVPDGTIDGADLSFFVEQWFLSDVRADVTTSTVNPGEPGYASPDGEIDGADLSFYVGFWLTEHANGCPLD